MSEKTLNVCLIAPVPPPYGGIGNWVLLLNKYVQSRVDVKFDIISTAPKSRGIDGINLWERKAFSSHGHSRINRSCLVLPFAKLPLSDFIPISPVCFL